MKYTFKSKVFGNTEKRFNEGKRWLIVKKDAVRVSIFVTDEEYHSYLCQVAVRMFIYVGEKNEDLLVPSIWGLPSIMRREKFTVDFYEDQKARVSGRGWWVDFDFDNKEITSSEPVYIIGHAGGWETLQYAHGTRFLAPRKPDESPDDHFS